MSRAAQSTTAKGKATRDRIVGAAAQLMYRHGLAGTGTPAVRDAAGVSSSQIYHYFADKNDLARAVITAQTEAILNAQQPITNLHDLDAWRDAIVTAAGRHHGTGGCPLGSLSSELSDNHPWARELLATGFDRWAQHLDNGLTQLVDNGTLRADTDTRQLALALLAAMQGGLLLAQAQHNTDALRAALDTVIHQIHNLTAGNP